LCHPPARYCTETERYWANEAFYISHGWVLLPKDGDEPGQFRFDLEVDGVRLDPTYVERSTQVLDDGPEVARTWVFNFPDGMVGEHTLTGSWITPCRFALEWGLVEACANPMADFEVARRTHIIDFRLH
jgi:hypothetical protein